jgi:glycosyltransferase involved in cell wall biosynthesis
MDYASEFNIPNAKIFMPGYVDNIWEYYKAMDIFLLPSRSEGFSLSLLEAAASHLPIIASNIPGNNEFIFNNKNGLLFNIENPIGLKEAIQVLSSDKKMRDDLSNNAYESVMKNYLIKNYADNLDNFLKQISQ